MGHERHLNAVLVLGQAADGVNDPGFDLRRAARPWRGDEATSVTVLPATTPAGAVKLRWSGGVVVGVVVLVDVVVVFDATFAVAVPLAVRPLTFDTDKATVADPTVA